MIEGGAVYFYTYSNIGLLRLKKRIAQGTGGCYLLYGVTATGKTAFLKEVFQESKEVLWYTSETLIDELIRTSQNGTNMELPQVNVMIIENVEELMGRIVTQEKIEELFTMWMTENTSRKIIMTTNQKRVCNDFSGFCETITIHPVRMTRKKARKYCKEMQYSFTKQEMQSLYIKHDMIDFQVEVNRILMQRIMDEK